MDNLLPVAVLLELILALITIFIVWKYYQHTTSDSVSYAIIVFMSLYSAAINLFLFCKVNHLFYIFDLIVIVVSLFIILYFKKLFLTTSNQIIEFIVEYKKLLFPFLIIYIYLLFQSLLLPPCSWDSMVYYLPRIIMMQKEGSIILNNFNPPNQHNFFLGFDVLHYLILRFYSDWFLGFFSFLCYTVIITSTYSLVKKAFNDIRLGVITALLIGSLMLIVLQSTSTKNDIALAALATTCFLSLYNYIKFREISNVIILIICLIFGVTIKVYFIGFTLAIILFMIVLYCKEFCQILFIFKLRLINKFILLYVIAIVLIMSFVTFTIINYVN